MLHYPRAAIFHAVVSFRFVPEEFSRTLSPIAANDDDDDAPLGSHNTYCGAHCRITRPPHAMFRARPLAPQLMR